MTIFLQKSLGTDDGSEDEDDMSVERNWKRLDGEVVRATIELNEYGLGISLAGTPPPPCTDFIRIHFTGFRGDLDIQISNYY